MPASRSQLASAYGNIGTIHYYKGEYSIAALYFDSTLLENILIKGRGDITATTMINLSSIYLRLRQPETALKYLKEGEALCEEKQHLYLLALIQGNKGKAWLQLAREDKAMHYFQEELKIAQEIKDTTILINAYANLGNLLLLQKKPEEALVYLQQAEGLSTPNNPYQNFIEIRKNLGFAYFQLRDYEKAEQQLQKVLNHAEQLDIKDELPDVYKILVEIYEGIGDYRQALIHQKQLQLLNDNLFNLRKIKEINELEVKYRTAEKDKQLLTHKSALKEKEHKLKENRLWAGVIAGGVILLFASFLTGYRNRQKIQRKEIQLLKQEKEMNRLKYTMDGEEQERKRLARELHDGIGGMLAAINMNLSAVYKRHKEQHQIDDLDAIIQMVEDTTDEVRKTAHNLMPDVLTQYRLPHALRIYCEQMSVNDDLHISLSFAGLTDPLPKFTELIIYRIVQELIQNIIKHAEATEAVVEMTKDDDKIVIIVEDNGTGFDIDQNKGGYGLQNLRHRVQSLKGQINIESSPTLGTTVFIIFNLDELEMKSTGESNSD